MNRHKYRVRLSSDGGSSAGNKQDTPVRRGLDRRRKIDLATILPASKLPEYRRLLPNKPFDALQEEPEEMDVSTVKPDHTVLMSIKPVRCKSVLRLSIPAFTDKPRAKAGSAKTKSGCRVSPAGHQTIQTTPEPEAFKGGEKMSVKEEERNLTVTPKSITSSSMESDTTFTSDDDEEEEEDCHTSSTTSSSLSSPEIFRRESYVETQTFPMKDELPGLHLHIKNSTLLDVSHAEGIHMRPPLNLSNIIDASAILVEKNCEIDKNKEPEADTKIHLDSFKPESVFKQKTSPKLTNRKPISYKKKVWFKSPIVAVTFEAKHTPITKLTTHNASEPAHVPSPVPEANPSRAGEIRSKEGASQLTVKPKRLVRSSPEKAKFFDFVDDSDRDAFFKEMRERCVKLRSAALFPLTAPKYTEPYVLQHLKPKYCM